MDKARRVSNSHFKGHLILRMVYMVIEYVFINKLKCCEFKGKQASIIESTSLCCGSYSVFTC